MKQQGLVYIMLHQGAWDKSIISGHFWLKANILTNLCFDNKEELGGVTIRGENPGQGRL